MNKNGDQRDRSGLLVGITKAAEFLGVSEKAVYRFLTLGMPGRKIQGQWFFHKHNIEAWWQKVTWSAAANDDEVKTKATQATE